MSLASIEGDSLLHTDQLPFFVACFLCTPVSYTSGDDLEQSANSLLIQGNLVSFRT